MAPTVPRPTSAPPSSNPGMIVLSSSEASIPGIIVLSSSSEASIPGLIVLSSSSEDDEAASSRRQPPPRNQSWTFHDEVHLLTALAAGRRESGGQLPGPSALRDSMRGKLSPAAGDVAEKVRDLRERFRAAVAAGGPRDERRDRRLYDLSVEVWPELLPASSSASNRGLIVVSSSSSSDGEAASGGGGGQQPCNQCWTFRDEVKILKALAAGRRDAGRLPGPSALRDALRGNLMRENFAAGGPRDVRRDRKLYKLSMEVWPELLPASSSSSSSSSSSAATE